MQTCRMIVKAVRWYLTYKKLVQNLDSDVRPISFTRLYQVLILFNKHSCLVLQVIYVLTFFKGIITPTFVGYLIFATKMH